MKKILLVLVFVTSYWQVQAQLKISTTATKLCEGTDIPFQITGIPANANVQFQKDGVDFLPFNVNAAILKAALPGNYSAKAFAKDGKWSRKSPAVDYSYVRDVSFVNTKVGYAISDLNVIKTTDGGITWKELNTQNNRQLLALHFINEQTGWAVGEYNTILNTKDGGTTWEKITRADNWGGDPSNLFFNIFFIDSKTGWITDFAGVTLKTINGGATWTSQVSKDYNSVYKATYSDANTIWATDFNGVISKSINDGKTWTLSYDIYTDRGNNYLYGSFKSIYFVNAKNGWAVGDNGVMVNTIDGGKTWTIRKDLNFKKSLCGIFFTNSETGYAISSDQEYLQTTDGGINWVKKGIGINTNLSKLTFIDVNNGFGVGGEGVIIKTSNGGATWEKLRGNSEDYRDISFINAQTGFRVGSYGLIEKSTDGGSSWKSQNSTSTDYLKQVQFFDVNTGWALPSVGTSILSTTDGGTTWKSQKLTVNRWPLKYFKFADSKNGFAVGRGSTIAKTTDGGAVWSQVKTTLDTNNELNSVFFSDPKNGWIVGESGTIVKTIDGGNTWNQLKLDPKYKAINFASAYFFDAKNGFVLTYNYGSALLKTTDGGITWSEIPVQLIGVQSLVFTDSKNGWINSFIGNLYKTTDGGNNWESVVSGTSNSLSGISFLNAQTGWAVGSGNTYVKYEAQLLSTSNTITINPKPAAPTLAWNNSDGKLTATTTTTSPQLTWLKGVDELKNITATTYQPTSSGSYSVQVTDGNGCSEISKAVEVTILASDNPLDNSGVSVYPNPSSNGIFKVAYTRFSNEMEATMQVIGLDGLPLNSQKMVRQNNTFEGELNASNLATGIYLLQIVSGEQKAVVKISIAK